jgi:hypothetical protein
MIDLALKQLRETELISRKAAKIRQKEIAATRRKERKKGMTEARINFGGTVKREFATAHF